MALASGRPVRELQESFDSHDFAEILALAMVEPPPHEQIVFVICQLCAIVSNIFGANNQPGLTAHDYLPNYDGDVDTSHLWQTPEQIKATLWQQAETVNAKIAERDRRAGL